MENKFVTKKRLKAELTDRDNTVEKLEQALKESKEREDGLRKDGEKYKSIVENSQDGIYILQNFEIKYCNPQFAKMFGFAKPEEALGENIKKMVNPKSLSLVTQEIESRESGKKAISHYSFFAKRLDGSELEVESLDSRIRYKGKWAVQGVMRDVSQQKQLERQLRQSQKMEAIGTLAGGIAHDFNNILSVIIGYIELSREDFKDEKRLKRYLEYVLKASSRAKDLVQQILSFSRQTEKERRPVQVTPVLDEVLKLIRASLPSTIKITQDISTKTYIVMGDSTQLHQILMNIITNGAHAMRDSGGTLGVVLTDINRDLGVSSDDIPAPYLRLSISDTGHGIKPEIMERIFDPFFTTKKTGEGTGLGLSVVHGIVRSFDGEISVESVPGKGTTFHIFIPVLEEKKGAENVAQSTVPRGSERILLVDDEEILVDMTNKMLTRLGYDVVPVNDSLKALEIFKADPAHFDLVLTDLTMPDLTGKQLAVEILKIKPGCPIILCTGFSGKVERDEIKAIGIKALIMKPYTKKIMAETIREIVGKSEKSKESA
ncbi:MAG: PAS domain S-box protein [bacterium]|nr:PAS domain S-box protein [bacterium]